ncbi:MAG: PDZ domain-containing protein, partial [Planctomycetota bacterium]
LDWPSVKQALRSGPYYTKPLVTEFGEVHSHKDPLRTSYKGEDGRRRAFSLYLPKSYRPRDLQKKIPVLFYLHHNASNSQFNDLLGSIVLPRFQKYCEQSGFMFVAPSTNRGCEWWTPEGKKFIRWVLGQLRARYNIDEDRIALVGAQDGGNAVWLLAQEMPDTFSCLVPLTSNPSYTASVFRPLYLGTLDRMDVLMGIAGRNPGGRNLQQMLQAIKPMVDHRMRITTILAPTATNDVRYFDRLLPVIVRFALSSRRKPLAKEVDIQTDRPDGRRSLWLRCGKVDPQAPVAQNLKDSVYQPPKIKHEEPKPQVGVSVEDAPRLGVRITQTQGRAQRSGLLPGDVLLEIDGQAVTKKGQVAKLIQKHAFGEDVELRVARETYEEDLDRLKREQRLHKRRFERLKKARAEGKDELDIDDVEEGEEEKTEEDEGCSELDTGEDVSKLKTGDEQAGAGDVRRKHFYAFTRRIHLRKPLGVLVRAGFGIAFDREHRKEGVRLSHVVPASHAWRSGFRTGDVIVGIGGEPIRKPRDIPAWFKKENFKFEEEKDSEVAFDVQRPAGHGRFEEKTVYVKWQKIPSARVDASWSPQDRILRVLTRHAASFTVYFSEDLIPPQEPFHLFINGVPYQDLARPGEVPAYPAPLHGDPGAHDRLRKLRRQRAKVEGWTPDPKWALQEFLKHRDRGLVFAASRTYDLNALKPGFEAAKQRREKRRAERAKRLEAAKEVEGRS